MISFVDCINRGDVDGLGSLMTDDHRLVVFAEPPLVGRAANVEAWRGYLAAWPDYVIYPRSVAEDGARVAVAGTTTGSHLGLPDGEEATLGVIWMADGRDGRLSRWQLVADEPAARRELGLDGGRDD